MRIMKSLSSIIVVLVSGLLSSCHSLTEEETQLKASRRRAEEERTVQAMGRAPVQPEGIKRIHSTEQLSKQH